MQDLEERTVKRILGRDQILGGKNSLKRAEVDVPELGGALTIRELDGLQGAEFQRRSMDVVDARNARIRDGKALANLNAQVIVWGAIDENGEALFTIQDIPGLVQLGSSTLDRVASAVLALSGLDKSGQRRAEKNFSTTPMNDFGTS